MERTRRFQEPVVNPRCSVERGPADIIYAEDRHHPIPTLVLKSSEKGKKKKESERKREKDSTLEGRYAGLKAL